jgi:DNA-binding MltR family transcriptional regulator
MKTPKAIGAEDLGVAILRSIDAEFRSAEDRALAVIGASYLDSILEQLLRAAFIDDEEEADRLLAPDRPIGANGARYQLAYCLGLISAEQRDDLKTIAKVRNLFAHNYSVASLEDERAKGCLKGLHFARRREVIRRELISRESNPGVKVSLKNAGTKHRTLLRDAVFELIVLLLPKTRDVRRAEPSVWFGNAGGAIT